MNIGSDENGNLTFTDWLGIISLAIGVENLKLNLQQEDLDRQTSELDAKLRLAVDDIHSHLQEQDRKIDLLLSLLEVQNDKD